MDKGRLRPVERSSAPASPSQAPVYVSMAVALIALVGAVSGAAVNYISAERSSDVKMVEIAIGVLRAPPSEDVAQIRRWAMEVVESGSRVKFDPSEKAALLRKPLPFVIGIGGVGMSAIPMGPDTCQKFKRNQDGSWTTVGRVTSGPLTMENVTFKNTGETRLLDALCGTGSSPNAQ